MASDEAISSKRCFRSGHSCTPRDETYIEEKSMEQCVLLLSKYRWIYDFKLTRFFLDRAWENIPSEWNDVVRSMTVEELSGLPFGECQLSWPTSLNQFIKDCLSLTLPRDNTPRQLFIPPTSSQLSQCSPLPDSDTDPVCRDPDFSRQCTFTSMPNPIKPSDIDDVIKKGMTNKKLHEVCHMTSLIDHVTKRSKCNVVVDVGSGLGYLGQVLHTKFGHPVLGLEGKQCHTSGAEKRVVKNSTCPFLQNVTCELQPTKESNKELLSLINDWFSSLSQEVSTCCHWSGSRDIAAKRQNKIHKNNNQSEHQSGSTEIVTEKSQTSQKSVTNNQTALAEITFVKPQRKETDESHSVNFDLSKHSAVQIPAKMCCKETMLSDKTKDKISVENDLSDNLGCSNIDTKCQKLETEPDKVNKHTQSNLNLSDNKKINLIDKEPQECMLGPQECMVGPQVCMVGLHCCGDLTPTMLKCFQELDCIRSLCCVSCCYHRMKYNESSSQFESFPMSSLIRGIIKNIAPCWNPGPYGMRLAAQETRARWRAQSARDHDFHTRNVAYRGILELCLQKGKFSLRKTSRKLVHERDFHDFTTYVDAISKHIDIQEKDEAVSVKQFRDKMTALYQDYEQYFTYIEPITALQVLLQPVLESLIYQDRKQWLLEHGISADIVPVFDEFISPRNLALVAIK